MVLDMMNYIFLRDNKALYLYDKTNNNEFNIYNMKN